MHKKLCLVAIALAAYSLHGITLRNFPAEIQEIYADTSPLITLSFDSSMRYEKYAWVMTHRNTEHEVGVPGSWLYQFLKKSGSHLRLSFHFCDYFFGNIIRSRSIVRKFHS